MLEELVPYEPKIGGIGTVVRGLQNLGISEVDLGLVVGSMVLKINRRNPYRDVDFSVRYEGGEMGHMEIALSTPRFDPYNFTGREKYPYQEIWNECSEILPSNPWFYLGGSKMYLEKVENNIPNALHITMGWILAWDQFVKKINQKQAGIHIRFIGKKRDKDVISRLSKVYERFKWLGLYQGVLLGDASPEIRS